MLIILKGADFSANKIGTVVMPRDSVDVTTASILANYTKTLTTEQIYAFDDFIIGVKAAGLWDKTKRAYFPFLAANVDQALFDAKDLIDIAHVTNAGTLTKSAYILENYGLKTAVWASGDGLHISGLTYATGQMSNSLAIATLFKSTATPSKTIGNISEKAYILTSTGKGVIWMGNNTNGIKKLGTTITDGYHRFIATARTPADAVTDLSVMTDGDLTSTTTIAGTYVNPDTECLNYVPASGTYDQYNYNPWPVAMQLFCTELTNEEMATLDGLMAKFNTIITQ